MSVKLGTNPIAWSNDDLRELGKNTSLETCLSEAREAGFSGIELGHKFPRSAEKLRPLLEAQDLALISGWYSSELLLRSPDAEIKAMQPHLDLLRAMDCEILIFAETSNATHGDRSVPLSRRPVLSKAQIQNLTRKMNEVADYVASEGLKLCYHHHMGTVIQSESDIHAMMEAAGKNFWLLLDTGHATVAGANPLFLAKAYRERIAHIHCKDVRETVKTDALTKDRSFLDAVVEGIFTVPGDGAVNFVPILQEMKTGAYQGWLVVEAEQDPAKANPLEYARLGHANLLRFAQKAGLV